MAKQGPDQSPAIEKILKKRRHPEPYDSVPTEVEGVTLRAEAGTRLDILRATIGAFAVIGTEFADRKKRINKLQAAQKNPETYLKTTAQAHEGLRGMESKPGNFRLNVFPRYVVTWDFDKLRASLGASYESVVQEDVSMSLLVPVGYETQEGPLTPELLHAAVARALDELGIAKTEQGPIVDTQVVRRVDETQLADLIEAGRVSLEEGTGVVTETWAITVDPLKGGKTPNQ